MPATASASGCKPRGCPPPAEERSQAEERSCRRGFKRRRFASRSSRVSHTPPFPPPAGGQETGSPDSPRRTRQQHGRTGAVTAWRDPHPVPTPALGTSGPASPSPDGRPPAPSSPHPAAGEGEPGRGQTTPPGRRRRPGRSEAAGAGDGTGAAAVHPGGQRGGRGRPRQRREGRRRPATTPPAPRSPHQVVPELLAAHIVHGLAGQSPRHGGPRRQGAPDPAQPARLTHCHHRCR